MRTSYIWISSILFYVVLIPSCLCVVINPNIDSNSLIVQTDSGAVQGFTIDGSVNYWLGIPYASPPVGNNRFNQPVSVTPWNDILQANTISSICLQPTLDSSHIVGSEDCLYLNIYAPAPFSSSSPLSVMVFIHGGGFLAGDGYQEGWYNGSSLAFNQNVIVVTMNYRLGALGFLALEELIPISQDNRTGNYGLDDQRAALQWIQRNIEQFGGNPKSVTLFGESAGGSSIAFHLVSPLSSGLFHSVIMESGPPILYALIKPYEITQEESRTYINDVLSCNIKYNDTLTCLYSMPAEEIIALNVTVNHITLSEQPIYTIASGQWNSVPVMIGSNLNETTFFMSTIMAPTWHLYFPKSIVPSPNITWSDNDIVETLRGFMFSDLSSSENQDKYISMVLDGYNRNQYREAGYSPLEYIAIVSTDYLMRCGSKMMGDVLSDTSPVYFYNFQYKATDWGGYQFWGDYHTMELYYIFNTLASLLSPQSEKFSKSTIQTYWANFAKSNGNPNNINNPELTQWFQYTSGDINNTLSLEYNPIMIADSDPELCELWYDIYALMTTNY